MIESRPAASAPTTTVGLHAFAIPAADILQQLAGRRHGDFSLCVAAVAVAGAVRDSEGPLATSCEQQGAERMEGDAVHTPAAVSLVRVAAQRLNQLESVCAVQQHLVVLTTGGEVLAPGVQVEGHFLVRAQSALYHTHAAAGAADVPALDEVVVPAARPQVASAGRPAEVGDAVAELVDLEDALGAVLGVHPDALREGHRRIRPREVRVEAQRGDDALLAEERLPGLGGGDGGRVLAGLRQVETPAT